MVGWYVGAGINLVGSIAINLGTNVMKLGHNKRAAMELPEAEKPPVKKIREWQIGVALFAVGNVANFISFGYAAQSLLAALGCIQFVSNVAFAYWVLKETVTFIVLAATSCIVAGCILLVIFGNHDSKNYNVKLLMELYHQVPYLLYLAFSVITVVVMFLVYRTGYHKMKSQEGFSKGWMMVLPVAYALFSGLIGTQSVLLSKSLSVLLRETFAGNNQLTSWFTYVVLPLFLATAAFWVTRLNKGLRMFPAMVIVPTMQISWTLFSIISGMLYFQEYDGFTPLSASMFGLGVVVVFAGVFLLTKSQGTGKKVGYERMEEEVALKTKLSGASSAGNLNSPLGSLELSSKSLVQQPILGSATMHPHGTISTNSPSSALPPVNPTCAVPFIPSALGPSSLGVSWSSTPAPDGTTPPSPREGPLVASPRTHPSSEPAEMALIRSLRSTGFPVDMLPEHQQQAAMQPQLVEVATDLINLSSLEPERPVAQSAGRQLLDGLRALPSDLMGLGGGTSAKLSLGLGDSGVLPAISLFAVPAVDLSGSWSLTQERGQQLLTEMEVYAAQQAAREAQQASSRQQAAGGNGIRWHSNSTFTDGRLSAGWSTTAHQALKPPTAKYLDTHGSGAQLQLPAAAPRGNQLPPLPDAGGAPIQPHPPHAPGLGPSRSQRLSFKSVSSSLRPTAPAQPAHSGQPVHLPPPPAPMSPDGLRPSAQLTGQPVAEAAYSRALHSSEEDEHYNPLRPALQRPLDTQEPAPQQVHRQYNQQYPPYWQQQDPLGATSYCEQRTAAELAQASPTHRLHTELLIR